MGLVFPFRRVTIPHRAIALGGIRQRPRPLIDVTLIGPSGAALRTGLLDTGSDDTIFPEADAVFIGLDLTQAPISWMAGVGSAPAAVRYARVTLRLTDGVEQREWPAWVGFTAARLNRPLLGFAGCLQFFAATFHGDREQVELSVAGNYPGR
jgi:hypothetical protein